jgi:hypothetical protein
VQSRPVGQFKTLFGKVEIESPYLRHPQSGSPFNMVIFVQEAWRSRRGYRSDRAFAPAAFSWDREDASDISAGPPMTPAPYPLYLPAGARYAL